MARTEKAWWQSKIIWSNIITVLIVIVSYLTVGEASEMIRAENPKILVALGLLNIVLRSLSSQRLVLKPEKPENPENDGIS